MSDAVWVFGLSAVGLANAILFLQRPGRYPNLSAVIHLASLLVCMRAAIMWSSL